MFTCPNCKQIACEYPAGGVVIVVCPSCTYKYELSAGTVTSFTSRGVEVRPATDHERALYARQFELTLAISHRERVRFTFGTDRDDEWIRIASGDEVVVVYGMRKERRETLLFIVNRSRSERFVLGTPDARAKNLAAVIGGATAVASGIGAFLLTAPGPIVVVASIGMGALAFLAAKPLLKPTHELQAGEHAELNARQELLEEKQSLLALRMGVRDETEERLALRKRLDDLRARMVAVRLAAYAGRIDAINRAMQTLDTQIDVDRQLVSEYDRTLQILDIEYDASVTADAISDDSAAIIATRRAELRAAEERRAETTRRLSANAEVEALLGGDAG